MAGRIKSYFSKFLDKLRYKRPQKIEKDAAKWFLQKALELQKPPTPQEFMSTPGRKKVALPVPGKMYLFHYDPKWKMTLPYYDRFPLIFPLSLDKDYMLGINMHYLPYEYRAKLMDALYDTINKKNLSEDSKLNISYGILKSASKYKYFKPTIKKYLKGHLRSRFIEIPATEWSFVLMLPLERFYTKNSPIETRLVWEESKKKINY